MRQNLVGSSLVAALAALASAQSIDARAPSFPSNQGFFANVDASSPQMLADSFVVDAVNFPLGVTLGRVDWWGFVSDNLNPEGPLDISEIEAFHIDVYNNDGPGGAPGTLVQDNLVLAIDLEVTTFGGPTDSDVGGQAYALGANLPIPVSLAAAETYWIAINADVAGSALADGLFSWITTGSLVPDTQVAANNSGSWFTVSLGTSLAFAVEQVLDSDADGLSDADEINIYGTDPFDEDTDDDGVTDGDEIDLLVNGGLLCLSPLNPDSDGDSVSDGDEQLLMTNPCDADTDGDGLPDNLDPLPLDPGGNESEIEQDIRDIATTIELLPLDEINAKNEKAAAGRQNALCSKLNKAAKEAAEGDFAKAIDRLEKVLDKINGDPRKQWLVDDEPGETTKADIIEAIEFQILVLTFLL